jgi:hypothetical protein
MTDVNASLIDGVINNYASGTADLDWPAAVMNAISSGVIVKIAYKNEGWYATGSVFEVWVTIGGPSTLPPSGHSLADIGYEPLQL